MQFEEDIHGLFFYKYLLLYYNCKLCICKKTIATDLTGLGPIDLSCTSAKSSTCQEHNMKNLVVNFNFFHLAWILLHSKLVSEQALTKQQFDPMKF